MFDKRSNITGILAFDKSEQRNSWNHLNKGRVNTPGPQEELSRSKKQAPLKAPEI